MTKARMKCQHCGRKPVNRPRGLCWGCYYARGVRGLYSTPDPEKAKYIGAKDHFGHAPASEPCPHLPGTAEHQKALADRVTKGESLYHPDDKKESLK